ncbi:MAG TPA: prolyl oligopeptidase family serine peptidase [Verrucomicrobiae bacterium]
MNPRGLFRLLLLLCLVTASWGQEYQKADRESPGDEMIQEYVRREAVKLETTFLAGIRSREEWGRERPRLMGEYFHMLGLSPLPERTPLHATVTRTLDRGDYFVDMLHYQSRPGLYVTANLYRPKNVPAGEKLPTVLYVCGHSGRGRSGNKTAFQSHGIWLARHGYICLMVDTLQLGEIAGIHHGTYREGRWWWLSRGYTPAGVECWNGVRGIDYLASRPDVDAERIAVTGISGGGAATFWIAAADERAKAAVPVSGMADLVSYLPSRMINGHCDCMFLYNTYQWHWTQIAGMIAPRPMLFVNSDNDPIFPMDANDRIINRLERLYSHYGASDVVDAFVSIGGHDYRKDIRQGVFRFLNTHLKGDAKEVGDTEVDLVTGNRDEQHPIRPEELRVFPKDENIPADALNGKIDESFVEIGKVEIPKERSELAAARKKVVAKLREITFRHFPEKIPAARASGSTSEGMVWLNTEENIRVRAKQHGGLKDTKTITVVIANEDLGKPEVKEGELLIEPRGIGGTHWTTKNPPNYVERSHYLLGRTVDSGRVWDVLAAVGYLKAEYPNAAVRLKGEGRGAVLAMYAALLDELIRGVEVVKAPKSLMDEDAPALLNALRVCDLADVIQLLGNRELKVSE